MKKRRILYVILIIILIVGIVIYKNYNYNNIDIDEILKSDNYSYLSNNAKEYIKNYYNETGEILLTEKNKVNGKVYLNPDYVEYLDGNTSSDTGYMPNALTYDYGLLTTSTDNLPRKYDSRNVDGINYITPIKEQYSELCWDYSFTSVIESKLLKEEFETNALTLDLSERQMDYATSDPVSSIDTEKNPYFGGYLLNGLADSGNQYRYTSALVNGIFPINEDNWNYDKEYMGKVKPEDIYDLTKIDYQVNEILYIKDNNYNVGLDEETNKTLKEYIINNGSIVTAIRVGAGQNYVSYYPTGDEKINEGNVRTYLYYKDASAIYQSNDHMVAIIGWNDDYVHNVCILSEGKLTNATYNNGTYKCSTGTLKTINGAWIVKDSSSAAYQYVAYETVKSEYYVVDDISRRNWDNVYSSSNENGYIKNESKYIFNKLSNSEKITSIKFYSTSAINNLNIYINTYDGTGEKLLTTYNVETAGMHTIPINDTIILSSDKFSINITNSSLKFSVFTSNYDNNIKLDIKDAKVVNSFNYQSLLNDYQNLIVLNGISRHTTNNINYIIKDSNGNNVTDSFNIIRNYSVGNHISSVLRFNKNISLGEYTGYAFINNVLYSTFNIKIDKYMEKLTGDGSENNPYIITNPTQLDMIRLNKYNYYKLGNDIDLTYDTQNEKGLFYNDGKGWNPISYSTCTAYSNRVISCNEGFTGVFDGNNHKIIGLYINRPNEDVIGLFKNSYNNNYSALNFRNIILKNVNITGNNYVGGLIGYAHGTTYERHLIFENISVSGSITGNNYVGGLIGYFYGGTGLNTYLVSNTSCIKRHCLNNLFNSAKIEGNNYIGGIIGLLGTQTYYNTTNSNWRSTINAYNWQNNGTITSNNNAAGFVGYILINNGNSITLNNSINTGIVKANSNTAIVNDVECTNSNNTYPNCSLTLNNIYYINNIAYKDNSLINSNNVQKYNITDLTNDNIYNSFTNFNNFYKKETINNIKRIPFLKNANITYTNIQDILIENKNNISIYDYIDKSNNITYNIDDETIASISNNGTITPLNNGTTTVHITSYYDGYDNDINITVDLSNVVYTITYNLNGGIATNPTTYTVTSDTFTLVKPTKEGYTFTGWTGSNGTTPQKEVTIIKGTTGNLTYTANWTPVEYTITYNLNGGIGTNPTTYTVTSDTFTLVKPTKEGYTFTGWTGSNGTTPQKEVTIIKGTTGNLTYTANWTPVEYTITYNLNGGIGTNPTTYTVTSDTFTLVKPTKEGYTFTGWTGSNGTTPQKEVTIIKGTTGNLTYTANWTPVEYTITYNLNGGIGTNPTTYTVTSDTFTLVKPTKEGYTFTGWTGSNGTIPQKEVTIIKETTGNLTYTANWTPVEYTITYNLNGGIGTNPTTYTVTSDTFTLVKPTKEGYTFTGWTGSNGTTPQKEVTIIKGTTGNLTYMSNWEIIYVPLSKILTDNNYNINNSYVSGFTAGERINTIKSRLNDANITFESSTNIISTGTNIKKGNEKYSVIIKGDINGDGKINSGDLLQMRKYLLEEINLLGPYKEAGIIASQNDIKSLDLLRLRQYLLGEYNIE